jgi:hypothetical protein
METDPLSEQRFQQPIALNANIPAWIVDDLDTLTYLTKRKGYKVTKSGLIAAILTAFLNGDSVQAREIREFKSRVQEKKP